MVGLCRDREGYVFSPVLCRGNGHRGILCSWGGLWVPLLHPRSHQVLTVTVMS